MHICIAPLGALAVAAASIAVSLGHEATLLDSFGRCLGLLEEARLPEKVRLVDAAPGSKALARILRRCDVLLLALDPWDAASCRDWGRVTLGYALDALESGVERLVVTLPAGAYAWSGERVECGLLPRLPPPVYEYAVPLSIVSMLFARPDSLLAVVIPPLVHLWDERALAGRPEPLNWFERLLETRVLEAREEAELSLLDYRDAAETLVHLAEGWELGFTCVRGVVVRARDAAEKLGFNARSPRLPDTIVVGEGGGTRRRTVELLTSLGLSAE